VKGQSSIIKIVALIVLVSLAALLIMSSAGNVLESAENVNKNTSGEVNESSDTAGCIAECRAEYPRGGPQFFDCKEDNDCV
jgi:hypothetical protein